MICDVKHCGDSATKRHKGRALCLDCYIELARGIRAYIEHMFKTAQSRHRGAIEADLLARPEIHVVASPHRAKSGWFDDSGSWHNAVKAYEIAS